MKDYNGYKHIIMLCVSFLILAALTAMFGYVWYTYYEGLIGLPFFRRGNWLVIGVYALLSFSFTKLYDGYKIGYLKRGDVIYSSALSSLFVNGITYLQISLMGRRFLTPVPMIILSFADIACILIWAFSSIKLYQSLYPPHKMLVIYGGDAAEGLITKMNTRPEKYDICEMISITEGFENICERIDLYDSVIICDVKSQDRSPILKYCFEKSVRTYLTPKISDTIVRGADKIHLFDTPLLLCRNKGLNAEQEFLKRAMDLILSCTFFIAAFPFMCLIAAAVKLYDKGPVLYRQTRLTNGGREFTLYKFRSMVVDAEKKCGAQLAEKDDPRITPVGRFLRRLRLDELPQLINIIKGDMSIVGPRPERPELAREHEKVMPEFSFRLKVKAGLTGYAQVLGKYNTNPYDKLKLDLMYIEQYSLLLDLQLILMTIKILFMPHSTEGVENNKSVHSQPPFYTEDKKKH